MTNEQIKYMVNRFLAWRLPENFNPDGGITFKARFNEHTEQPMKAEPIGTNLFDYTQAEEMVRYMVEELPASDELTTTREIARELAEALLVIARMLARFPAQGVLIRNGDWPDSVQPQCAIRKASAAYRIADLALAKARAAGILNAKEQK